MTPAQNAAIKADIIANNDLNVFPNNSDGADAIAHLYNLPATPAAQVWDSAADVNRIQDAIDFTKYTPVDAPEATGIYTARALAIQTKQMNLQTMLIRSAPVNAKLSTVRANLRDAVTVIPAGANGANISPGGASGVNVMNALLRPTTATRLEKLLSAGAASTGGVSAEVLTFEGPVGWQEIQAARNS